MATSSRDRHLKRMSAAFCKFRETDVLCDTTLVTTDRVILAHSVILASASNVFREAFQLSMGDANGRYRFELESISGAVMEAMLYLIYTGVLQVPCEDSTSLAVVVEACKQLGIQLTSTSLVDGREIEELNADGNSTMKQEDSCSSREVSSSDMAIKDESSSIASQQGFHSSLGISTENDAMELGREKSNNEANAGIMFVCDVCTERFATGPGLQSHRRRHRGCIDCVECGVCFESRGALSEHLCRSCPAVAVVCNLCSKEYVGRTSLAVHAATDHIEAVVCSTCCQPFGDSESSRLHESLHDLPGRFYSILCSCGLHCRTKVDLKAHQMTSGCDARNKSAKFCCCACGLTLKKRKIMLSHISMHGVVACKDSQRKQTNYAASFEHSTLSKVGEQLTGSLASKVCGPTSEESLCAEKTKEVRQSKNSRPLSCAECSKTFTRISDLQAHVRRHTGEMGYDCPVCGREFRKKNTLQRHLRVHTGERPYVCEVCGKSFKIMFHLQLHRSIHLTERAFTCSICMKAFQSAVRLKKHSAVHTDVKPYSCPICARAFNRSGNMRAHMKIHEADQSLAVVGETSSAEQHLGSFRCDKCGNAFSRLSGLKSHHARVHPESSAGDAENLLQDVGSSSAVQVVYCKRVDDQADDSFISMPITVHFSDDETNFIC